MRLGFCRVKTVVDHVANDKQGRVFDGRHLG